MGQNGKMKWLKMFNVFQWVKVGHRWVKMGLKGVKVNQNGVESINTLLLRWGKRRSKGGQNGEQKIVPLFLVKWNPEWLLFFTWNHFQINNTVTLPQSVNCRINKKIREMIFCIFWFQVDWSLVATHIILCILLLSVSSKYWKVSNFKENSRNFTKIHENFTTLIKVVNQTCREMFDWKISWIVKSNLVKKSSQTWIFRDKLFTKPNSGFGLHYKKQA